MSALKKITTQAKKLLRTKKAASWKSAIKKASAEYRAGKLGKVGAARKVSGTHKRRKKVAGHRSAGRKKQIAIIRKSHAIEGRAIDNLASLGSIKARGKKIVREKLSTALVARELAPTKTAKRKAAKRVAALKKDLKNWC